MKDMTKGNPLKLILSFSLPLLASNIFQQLYNSCDTIMIGRMVGVEALAAIGATMPVFFMIVVIGVSFATGNSLIAAQCFGQKDYNKMRNSVAISTTLSLGFGAVFYFAFAMILKWVLSIASVPDNVFDLTYSYLFIMCCFGIVIMAFNLLQSFLRAIGNSRGPLYFLVLSSILNVVFNYIFIKYFKLGIVGSAYGTVVAIFVSTVVAIIYIYRKYPILIPCKADFRFSWRFAKEHLRLAMPMTAQGFFICLSLFIFQKGCNNFGYEAMAAVAAGNRLEALSGTILYSIGLGLATYVAQNYGKGRIARIRKGVFQTSVASLAVAFLLGVFTYIFSDELVSLFIKKEDLIKLPNVLALAKKYICTCALFYFFLAHIFVYRNALQGVGNSFMPLVSSFVELLFRIICVFYLIDVIEFEAIIFAQPMAWVSGVIVLWIGYYFEVKKLREKVKRQLVSQSTN